MSKKRKETVSNTKGKKIYSMIIMIICLGLFYVAPVFAADAVTAKIGNIESLVSGIITAAGAIVLLWGVFEFASAYQSHDTSQQTQSLKKVVSGLIMVAAPTIVGLLK